MDKWKQISPAPGTVLFDQIYQKILKDSRFDYPCEGATINLVNKKRSKTLKSEVRETFRIILEWQSEEICGVDIYKKVE